MGLGRRYFARNLVQGGNDPVLPVLTGLQAWYDATDLSTLSFDIDDHVEEIADKSGNLRHSRQTTSAERPDYTLSGINSKGSLLFNSLGQNLRASFNLGALPLYAFIVYKGETIANTTRFVFSYADISRSDRYWGSYYLSNFAPYANYRGNATNYVLTTSPPENTTLPLIVGTGNYGSTLEQIKIPRVVSAIDNGNFTRSSTSTYGGFNTFLIGRLRDVSYNSGTDFIGQISEIILYSVNHSASDKNLIFNYLAEKYNLQAPVAL